MGIREKGMETEYRKIGEISGKNFVKKLFTKNMVIKINNEEEIEKIKKITDPKTLCHKYFIENKIKEVVKKEKDSVSLSHECVDNEQLQKIQAIKGISNITKVNLLMNEI